MMQRAFFDTNILLYAEDNDSPHKQAVARQLVSEYWGANQLVLSTQVLQEYYFSATRKLKIDVGVAHSKVALLVKTDVVQIVPQDILSAIELSQANRLSFWDSLIVQAASKVSCPVLFSEDLQHGQVIKGLQVINPFRK